MTKGSAREEVDGTTSLRQRAYVWLSPSAWKGSGLSPVNRCVSVLIIVSISLAVLESEPLLYDRYPLVFSVSEYFLTCAFGIEYVARLWSSAEDPRYGAGVWGRVRYALSPAALLDLLAISPLFLTAVGSEAFLFRLLRLLRILRLAKLGRYTRATAEIIEAVRSRRYELVASMVCALVLLLISSTFLYLVECDAQPEAFGSIPRAMWWSIATLTTVGYGDVIPVTPLGRVFGGVTAIIGIGLIAMPTGILAAAFSDALVQRRASGNDGSDDPL